MARGKQTARKAPGGGKKPRLQLKKRSQRRSAPAKRMIGPHRIVYVDGSVYPPAFSCFVQKTEEDDVMVTRFASKMTNRSKRGVERWVPDFTASEGSEVLTSVSGLGVCTETGTRIEHEKIN
jgi:hypothetical protein